MSSHSDCLDAIFIVDVVDDWIPICRWKVEMAITLPSGSSFNVRIACKLSSGLSVVIVDHMRQRLSFGCSCELFDLAVDVPTNM